MQKLGQFLCALMILPTKHFADVAVDLLKREMRNHRDRFYVTHRVFTNIESQEMIHACFEDRTRVV